MELSNTAMRKGACIAAALYLAPKALTYLCTVPLTTVSRVDQLRARMAFVRDRLKEFVGERTWFVLTDVVADNAWISFVAFSYLTFGIVPTPRGAGALNLGNAYFSFCAASWMIRFGLVQVFPSSRAYIGTRSHS